MLEEKIGKSHSLCELERVVPLNIYGKILLILFFTLFSVGNVSAQVTIKDLTGIPEDAGEIIHLHYMGKNFEFKISDYLMPEVGIQLIDVEKLNKAAKKINHEIEVKEQSAYMNESGHLVEHLTGVSLDQEGLFLKLQEILYSDQEMAGMLPVKLTPPRVTAGQFKKAMERRISGFSTYFNSRNLNRSHNISLASKAIDYYVVLPGEKFSFNHVVGERTVSKGYKRAPVIVRGELSEGVGGGICQVSSTLFNAADRAGLTILQRYSHSKQVGYVPSGRDATVSWHGPDFSFRNDYDHPIMIKSYAGNGVNTISIYSSRDLEVELRQTPEAPKALPKETRNHG